MKVYSNRAIMIIPALERDAANTLLEAAGYGPNNFNISLILNILDSKLAPTHYATNWVMTPEEYADVKGVLKAMTVEYNDLDKPDPNVAQPTLDTVLTTESLKHASHKL